jgi:hypothetical protein
MPRPRRRGCWEACASLGAGGRVCVSPPPRPTRRVRHRPSLGVPVAHLGRNYGQLSQIVLRAFPKIECKCARDGPSSRGAAVMSAGGTRRPAGAVPITAASSSANAPFHRCTASSRQSAANTGRRSRPRNPDERRDRPAARPPGCGESPHQCRTRPAGVGQPPRRGAAPCARRGQVADATRATEAACSAETVLALEERSMSDHAPCRPAAAA